MSQWKIFVVDGTGLSPWLLVKPMLAVCCREHQCFFVFPRSLKEMLFFCLFLAFRHFGGNGAWSSGRWHKTAQETLISYEFEIFR